MEKKEIIKQENVAIQDVFYLENIEQLKAISDTIRYQMVTMLTQPMTGAQLARKLKISRARAHYHLNLLKDVGIVQYYGEGQSHGITEKYYQVIGRMLDFSRLLQKTEQGMRLTDLTPETFKAVGDFLVTMLDVSRESIEKSDGIESLESGFWFDFISVLTPEQVADVKSELRTFREKIIQLTRENRRTKSLDELVEFRTTLFLTVLSDSTNEDEQD